MVRDTAARLASLGVAQDHIHIEDFGWSEPLPQHGSTSRQVDARELQTVTFPTSRLGRRGYEEGPVGEFLSAAHAEFVRLVNERTSLWQEVQRLRRRIIAGEDDGDRAGGAVR